MTRKIVHLGKKMRLVKDEEKAVAKAQDNVDSFIAAFKFLGKRKSIIIIVGLLSLIDLFAVLAFRNEKMNFKSLRIVFSTNTNTYEIC